MASIDITTVIEDLKRRFAFPLKEYYKRRIIFWYDEDKEFEDKLDDFNIDGVKLVRLYDNNAFDIKKLLSHDDLENNYLVYTTASYERFDDDWLLDIELYSEEFRSDLISIWMTELGMDNNSSLRRLFKYYRVFFNAKERRNRVASQRVVPEKPAQLHMAVMAAICGIDEAVPNAIIKAVLTAGLDNSSNSIYQDLIAYKADEAFWMMVSQGTGYTNDKRDLAELAIHILLTAATRTMSEEELGGLDKYISIPYQAYCFDFVSDWLHSPDNRELHEIAVYAENRLQLYNRFSKMDMDNLLDTECFPCINVVILHKIMAEICNQTITANSIVKAVDKRRTLVWYEDFQEFFDGMLQVANMLAFYKEHSAGFHVAQAYKIWKEYTDDYYRMDTYYRKFHRCFQRSLDQSNMLLDDLFKQVADEVEGLYSEWFLGRLGNNWSDVCADDLAQFGRISEIPDQTDFYQKNIKKAGTRVFVIISDALRYEVAKSLAEELSRDMQGQVNLSSMQGIFPTITKFGMAALLPHDKLTVEVKNEQLFVMADGMSTASLNRDAVLKNANPASVALQYKNIIGMKRADRSVLVKGMDVVYIYHDSIDEASHHSDSAVFGACDKAITELKNMVRIIVNEFSGTRIFITSDHGFLYTYSPLREDDKADKSNWDGMDVDYGRRHVIMRKGASPDYLMPVKFLKGKSDYEGFAPRESIRIKLSGSGTNFVHGGISLQEMVVPVIEYHHLRNASKEYLSNKTAYDTKPVSVDILSSSRKVCNKIVSLDFYQKEPVAANRIAATYQIYFADASGAQVSDVQRIIADKSSTNEQERRCRLTFTLKPIKFNSLDNYYLVIADESGLQVPTKTEFQIDIAFAIDEFDFFS